MKFFGIFSHKFKFIQIFNLSAAAAAAKGVEGERRFDFGLSAMRLHSIWLKMAAASMKNHGNRHFTVLTGFRSWLLFDEVIQNY